MCLVPLVPLGAQSLEGDRREEADEFQASRDLFLRQEKIVFRKGELLAELSNSYSSTTAQLFNVELKARSWASSINVQYGVLDGLQLGLQIPVFVNVVQEANDVLTDESVRDEDRGFGDVSGDLRYQLLGEASGRPDVILNLNVKSTTGGQTLRGSGHWNLGSGLTVVKTFDPAVIFARLDYTETLKRNGFNPGNIIGYGFGVGFSLNDRVSLNAQLSGAFLGRSRQQGTTILRSSREVASLLFATTILLDRHVSIEPVIGVGLTDDASDFTFALRLPYRF